MNRFVKKFIPTCVFSLIIIMGVVCGFAVKISIGDLRVMDHESQMIELKAKQAQENFNRSELYWLTMNVYHESRGENPFGKLLVALVTLERQADGRWGDTIKEVVTCPSQFSWYNDGRPDIPEDSESWNTAKQVAKVALKVYKEMDDGIKVTHYHNGTVSPNWSKAMERVIVVGDHTFYQEVN